MTPPAPAGPSAQDVILACEMMQDEVLLGMELAYGDGDRPPVVWVDSRLHDKPSGLRASLQDLVHRLDQAAEEGRSAPLPSLRPGSDPAETRRQEVLVRPGGDVLLSMGYCGGGLAGLVSRHHRLVFPRVDDCISLLLGGLVPREQIERDTRSFYLTKSWLERGGPFGPELGKWVERFGREQALEFRREMLQSYRRICLLETGAYDPEEWMPYSLAQARELGLDHSVARGSVHLLTRLFSRVWDASIVIVQPGEVIGLDHLLSEQADQPPTPAAMGMASAPGAD